MKKISALVIALLLVVSSLLVACQGDNEESDLGTVNISYYDETYRTAKGAYSELGSDLFTRNDFSVNAADPSIIKITDPFSEDYGMYYMYTSVLKCYKSTDLVTWKPAGYYGSSCYMADTSTEVGKATCALEWAPEVVYDETEEKYYMFFSASEASSQRIYLSYCAESVSPAGPFEVVSNGSQETDRTTYSTMIGDKFTLFNQDRLVAWANRYGLKRTSTFNNHLRTIDFHPFVDPVTSKKYLYFKVQECLEFDGKTRDIIVGVEMETWIKPKYETLTIIEVAGYYTVETEILTASINEQMYVVKGVGKNPWENDTYQSEGAWVSYHKDSFGNGYYYLTFSTYGYSSSKYAVWQAYSLTPLGSYTKLTYEEGGLLYSPDGGSRSDIFATGHHCFVENEESIYIFSHCYGNPERDGSRTLCSDEIKWIPITTHDGVQLDVMYANGPTTAIKNKFEIESEYQNIAEKAKVKANGAIEGDPSCLNDGLIRLNAIDETFSPWSSFAKQYVKEVTIENTTTFTLTFEAYKTVKAIMIYNSPEFETSFDKIARIEMDAKLANGKTFTGVINNLKFDSDEYVTKIDEYVSEITVGSSAIAEFRDMAVKEIRITVNVPEEREAVTISEIKVLGQDSEKKALDTATNIDVYKNAYNYVKKEDNSSYELYDGITIDGKFDESVWKDAVWQTYTGKDNGNQTVTLRVASYLGEEGVYFAFACDDKSVYTRRSATIYCCSSVELYLCRSGVDDRIDNAFCCTFDVSNRGVFRIASTSGFTEWVPKTKSPQYCTYVDGVINEKDGCNGYRTEFYMPYIELGLTEKPDYVQASPILNIQYSLNCSELTRTHIRWGDFAISGWLENNPQTWSSWANGLVGERKE